MCGQANPYKTTFEVDKTAILIPIASMGFQITSDGIHYFSHISKSLKFNAELKSTKIKTLTGDFRKARETEVVKCCSIVVSRFRGGLVFEKQ